VRSCPNGTADANRPYVHPPDDTRVKCTNGGMILTEENRGTRRKTCPSELRPPYVPIRTDLGIASARAQPTNTESICRSTYNDAEFQQLHCGTKGNKELERRHHIPRFKPETFTGRVKRIIIHTNQQASWPGVTRLVGMVCPPKKVLDFLLQDVQRVSPVTSHLVPSDVNKTALQQRKRQRKRWEVQNTQ
jgi:hypothetical protein